MSLVAHKYTPAEMPAQELEATFAARGHTVEYLLKSLREQVHSGTLSSFVITGPRGSGKSTIIQMVALRIGQDAKLKAAWMPVVFPEEQFNIGSLRDLLAATLQMLKTQGIAQAQVWLDKAEAETNEEQSLQLAMTGLREITRQQDKRLILFIENLNQLLGECLDDQMKGTFRRLLMSDPFMMVIGSAVHVFDSLKSYDEAFFNYFGQVPLGRLTAEEVSDLLRLRANFDGNHEFLKELPSHLSKVRAIVHLSGGNPRLILMLYELLTQREAATIVQCLRRLVDELTPLLKHEIENLPPQQRRIIHALMEKGGAAQPTDLVERTRLPLNAITTQLGRLKEAQFVEVLGGGKGRTANYIVPDKLFAVWYQMRYLGQNRRRIEMFVEVLRVWFEEEARIVTLRNLMLPRESGTAQFLRESATTAEYFAASLKGTQHERLATELCIYQWAKADLREAALVYADFSSGGGEQADWDEMKAYMGLADLLLERCDYQRAIKSLDEVITKNPRNFKALINRGIAKGQWGDMQGSISDCTAVIDMEDAPEELVGFALFSRSLAKRQLGDTLGAISDCTAVIGMEGAPKEALAFALVNRGITKGQASDMQGAIFDCTAVIEMEDAPKESVAGALVARGTAKGKLGDIQGAISDYTTVIAMKEAPKDPVARALVYRSVAKGIVNDIQGAVSDCTVVIGLEGAPKADVARAFLNRGVARGKLNDVQGAISDYTAIIDMVEAPKDQVARAVVNRGLIKGIEGDAQGAISDFTTVIELDSAPNEQVVRALLNRGLAKGKLRDTRAAISDFTAVIEMERALTDDVARALFNRSVAKGQLGDFHGEISDCTAVVEMENAPKESVARALVNRGGTRGKLKDSRGEISDYTAVIEMKNGAPKEQVARALANRGNAKAKLNDIHGAISDYNDLIGMDGVPKEDVIDALINRGFAKGQSGDMQGAISDCTSVVEMEGAPKEEVARALFNRGYVKGKLTDFQGAISDYTKVIEMSEVSNQQPARALFNRGLIFLHQDETSAAIEDWIKLIELGIMTDNLAVDAAIAAYRASWTREDYSGAKAVVTKLGGVVNYLSKEQASASAMRFLSSIISPTMKEAWSAAWRVLAETSRPEVKEALDFLKPVCAVLEGKDRAVLDGLPPEQREFAESVLRSFEAGPK